MGGCFPSSYLCSFNLNTTIRIDAFYVNHVHRDRPTNPSAWPSKHARPSPSLTAPPRTAPAMDLHEAQARLMASLEDLSHAFQKIPGSEILIRYIQSSYQNDPVRSAIELVLVIFFIRYLLSPSYATHGPNYVKLREDEIDELVKDWEPEPLVPAQTPLEKAEAESQPIIVGCVARKKSRPFLLSLGKTTCADTCIWQSHGPEDQALQRQDGHQSRLVQLLQLQRE